MKHRPGTFFLTGLLVSSLFISCKEAGVDNLQAGFSRLDEISQDRWEALSQKRIFFGHKSVGFNILDGLRDVISRRPAIKLAIRESLDPVAFTEPVFAHFPVGTNKRPSSKIEEFRNILDAGVGQEADIAILKFCYIDIDHETDIKGLFNSYVELVNDLENRFPDLRIITFTVPLRAKPSGIKGRLKMILGRLPWYMEDNIARNLYNDMLRDRFEGSLFDLAAVESRIDGTRKAGFRKNGRDYDMLFGAYTDDGGHLNPTGRQVVAIELLRFLTDIPNAAPGVD